MANCRACSMEITGPDRYCRNCGVQVAPTVTDFDDTRRFSPSARLPAVEPGMPDTTNPLYRAPSAPYAAPPQSAAPLSSLARLLLRKNLAWAMIALMLLAGVGLGIGIGRGTTRRPGPIWDSGRAARADVDVAGVGHESEEGVQKVLGFK